jgi:hypothetical protein
MGTMVAHPRFDQKKAARSQSNELSGPLSYTGARWMATIRAFPMIGAAPQ